MHHGRLDIVDVYWILDDVVAELVRFAVNRARFGSTSCKPCRKATWMMVSTKVLLYLPLAVVGSAELAAPNHERIVE